MKIIEDLLIWALLFLPATIWWIKSSCKQFHSIQSWADAIASFIMWIITVGITGSTIVFWVLVLSGGRFAFIF